MDETALLARFRDSTRDRLVRLGEKLARLDEDVRAGRSLGRDAVVDVERDLHALKGEARVMGFGDVAELAHAIEELLEAGSRAAWPQPPAAIDTLLHALDVLDRLVDERLAPGRSGEPDVASARDELIALATAMAGAADRRTSPRERHEDEPLERAPGGGAETVRVPAAHVAALAAIAGELRDAAAQPDPARIAGISARLDAELAGLRRVPLSTLAAGLPRIVRGLARHLGRRARLVVVGADAWIDRALLAALNDPLLHLVQNAVDHGIETPAARRAVGKPAEGTVTLAARSDGGTLVLEVADDGAGVDLARVRCVAVERGLVAGEKEAQSTSDEEVLRWILKPGFSSKADVTPLSGRGIGLDAVKESIEQLGGSLEVESVAGRGSRFVLRVPMG